MLTILGPAKTIDMSSHHVTSAYTIPLFLEDAGMLANQLKQLSRSEMKSLMKISDQLTALNFERMAGWSPERHNPESGNQALISFSGEVFNGLQARNLSKDDLRFAQNHVRILSGMYGVLRPLDLILPYRLEMGTRIHNPRGKNLYEFWSDRIPAAIAELTEKTKNRVLVNLASAEYFRTIDPANFNHRIITPVFKEQDGNGFRNVTIYAKKARGMMLRFIIRNRINNPEQLKAFEEDGYYYNSDLSDEEHWFFCR